MKIGVREHRGIKLHDCFEDLKHGRYCRVREIDDKAHMFELVWEAKGKARSQWFSYWALTNEGMSDEPRFRPIEKSVFRDSIKKGALWTSILLVTLALTGCCAASKEGRDGDRPSPTVRAYGPWWQR